MIIHKKYRKVNSYYLCDVLLSIFGDDSLSLYYEYIYTYIYRVYHTSALICMHTHMTYGEYFQWGHSFFSS